MRRILIRVKPRAYPALIEAGLLARIGPALKQMVGARRCFVITVPPVLRLWGRKLSASLRRAKLQHAFLSMPDGEASKTLATVQDLAQLMVRSGADRGAVVVAFGGGVTGDVAGFLASVYMRGVDCVQVPTTLLAQVDAAIGGKTGVNLNAGKNLVGTFHQPRAVLVDPSVLRTLPEREYRAGLYEALKCGVICNPKIFAFLAKERRRILGRDPRALSWLIAECVRVKAAVVAADERERGLRRILNFGHTIGHAIEAETRYRPFLHGEAVAWGMVAATLIAERLGRIRSADAQRIIAAVFALGSLPAIEAGAAGIQRRIATDKKTRDGVTHFVLPRRVGKVEIVPDVSLRVVREAIERVRELSRSGR
ncbi:MAG: 3-dehydroquinate synthase [Burkholderiales bacterium]